MKFLFNLKECFKYYEEHQKFPAIKFQTIPNISNARRISRAILVLLAYILIPEKRAPLFKVCHFTANSWQDFWFSSHHFDEHIYAKLVTALHGYEKAESTFKKFWNQEPSRISVPRTNQCSERAIKVMEEIHH